jgi:hypothetical protein
MKELQEKWLELQAWCDTHKEPDANDSDGYWREYWYARGRADAMKEAINMPSPFINKKGGQS